MQLQLQQSTFDELDADIYALSTDSPENHASFQTSAGLSYSLLSDPDMEIIEKAEMQNGNTSFRGFSVFDENGEFLHSEQNDLFGQQAPVIREQVEEILEEQ